MPSARGEIAIGLRCGCCICKWQHCDSSLSLHRPRHPTQKAIRDKERIDRDNTRSQSKHAQEMLSVQTVWNQLRPQARERDSVMVLGEGDRENGEKVKYWVMRPAYKSGSLCVISMNSDLCGLPMWASGFPVLAWEDRELFIRVILWNI